MSPQWRKIGAVGKRILQAQARKPEFEYLAVARRGGAKRIFVRRREETQVGSHIAMGQPTREASVLAIASLRQDESAEIFEVGRLQEPLATVEPAQDAHPGGRGRRLPAGIPAASALAPATEAAPTKALLRNVRRSMRTLFVHDCPTVCRWDPIEPRVFGSCLLSEDPRPSTVLPNRRPRFYGSLTLSGLTRAVNPLHELGVWTRIAVMSPIAATSTVCEAGSASGSCIESIISRYGNSNTSSEERLRRRKTRPSSTRAHRPRRETRRPSSLRSLRVVRLHRAKAEPRAGENREIPGQSDESHVGRELQVLAVDDAARNVRAVPPDRRAASCAGRCRKPDSPARWRTRHSNSKNGSARSCPLRTARLRRIGRGSRVRRASE